jgi:hypothetical protein
MRKARVLREHVGLEEVELVPCLLPVQVNRVKRMGLGGRAHLAAETRSAPVDVDGQLVAVT